jgi:hypothetical protein
MQAKSCFQIVGRPLRRRPEAIHARQLKTSTEAEQESACKTCDVRRQPLKAATRVYGATGELYACVGRDLDHRRSFIADETTHNAALATCA